MLKVYIAASMHAQLQVRQYAQELTDNNIECTSSWRDQKIINMPLPLESEVRQAAMKDYAIRDLDDIERSHVVVVYPDVPTSGGGFWLEMGYCIANKKPIIYAGSFVNNPFIFMNEVRRVSDWNGALQLLKNVAVRLGEAQKDLPDCLSNLDSALMVHEAITLAVLNAPVGIQM